MHFTCHRCKLPTFYLDVLLDADGPVCAPCLGRPPLDIGERIRLAMRRLMRAVCQ